MNYSFQPLKKESRVKTSVVLTAVVVLGIIAVLLSLPGKDDRPLEVRLQEYLMNEVPRNATVAVEGVDQEVLDKIERPIVWLANYTPSDEVIPLNVTVRGRHKLWVYLAEGEDLELNLSKQDLNWYNGTDVLRIEVYNADLELIYEDEVGDDGIDVIDEQFKEENMGPEQFHRVFVENDGQGAYKILLIPDSIGDDFHVTLISTRQNKMVFEDKIFWFSGQKLYIKNIGSDETRFLVLHSEAIKNYTLINNLEYYTIKINETHKTYNITLDESGEIFSIFPEMNNFEKDLIIETKGLISIEKNNIFLPKNMFEVGIFPEKIDYLIIIKKVKEGSSSFILQQK